MRVFSHASVAAVALMSFVLTRVAQAAAPSAGLTFDLTYARQCTPLNITWTPTSAGYPYSVYIMGIGSSVQSWRVNQDYQPEAEKLTFQYLVPVPSPTFSSFMVAVVDSNGNGNVSSVIPINPDSDAPTNCAAYAGTTAFFYAGDSTSGQPGDRTQCGSIKYYAVNPPYRGTAPFSISFVPINGVPITINIPQSDSRNESYFLSYSTLAFAAGVQFYEFMSDGTGGGTGGGSQLYTVGGSSNSSCLASSYKLTNKDATHALPVGAQTARFQNLGGAISLADKPASSGSGSSSGSSNHGGLIGGIIGAVIGVGAILVVIAGYIVYRRRQKRKRELERKEQPQFIDLDEDEFGGDGIGSTAARRSNNGVQQSYSVSPFTYEPAAQHSPSVNAVSEVMPYRDEEPMLDAASFPMQGYNHRRPMSTSTTEFDPSSHNSFHGTSGEALGMYDHPSRSPAGITQYPPVNASDQAVFPPPSSSSWQNVSPQNTIVRPPYAAARATGSSEGTSSGGFSRVTPAPSASSEFGAGTTNPFSQQNSSYVLRTRNADDRIDDGTLGGGYGNVGRQGTSTAADPTRLPSKMATALDFEGEGQRRTSRYVQHEDAGPLPAATRAPAEEITEEVPPSYASWAHHTSATTKS